MGSARRRAALVCFVVLMCLIGVLAPGSRSLAASLVSKLAHLRPAPAGSLTKCGPIPFILNPTAKKASRPPAPAKPKPANVRPKDSAPKAAPAAPATEDVAPSPR